MNCVNCGTVMLDERLREGHASAELFRCPQCAGLWLDAGQLDRVAYQVTGDIEFCSRGETGLAAGKCPSCDNGDLYEVKFLGSTEIVLRRCASCNGFWLNAGQLEALDRELAADMPVRSHGFADAVLHGGGNGRVEISDESSADEGRVATPPVPHARLTGATADRCPGCGELLAEYSLCSLRFEGCRACKGVWLFRDELRRLKDRLSHGSLRWLNEEVEDVERASASASTLLCPRCPNTHLLTAKFGRSQVSMSWCPQCHGRWLEQDAFTRIFDYLHKEAGDSTPAQVKAALLSEVRTLYHGGMESRMEDLLEIRSALSALYTSEIFEHPALVHWLLNVPRLA